MGGKGMYSKNTKNRRIGDPDISDNRKRFEQEQIAKSRDTELDQKDYDQGNTKI